MDDRAELVVLSLLAEGAKYGYLLSKEARARSEGSVRLTPGVLYPLLAELEGAGLVVGTWEEVRSAGREGEEGGGRKRKWYRLSAKGRRRWAKQAEEHRRHARIMAAFLAGGGQTA